MNEHVTYTTSDHTFVVCAYKESPYLESCIRSLCAQTCKGKILIATSTPNDHITGMAAKYGLPVFVRVEEEKGIAADWNFGLACAKTPLVTIAHQDDVYGRHYVQCMLEQINAAEHPLIAFSDYGERRVTEDRTDSRLLRIKRLLLLPLTTKHGQRSRWLRRRSLSMGNPICCPSVTYVMPHLKTPIFENNMESNIDWQAWERISREEGSFVYCRRVLMLHRIHEESTTSKLIEKDGRKAEDLSVFYRFWPKPIALLIEKAYQKSEESNEV